MSLLEVGKTYSLTRPKLANKWDKTGLLEGLGNENQKKQHVNDPRKPS